jgi:hypothetical protein
LQILDRLDELRLAEDQVQFLGFSTPNDSQLDVIRAFANDGCPARSELIAVDPSILGDLANRRKPRTPDEGNYRCELPLVEARSEGQRTTLAARIGGRFS